MAQHEINITADRSVWLDINDEYSRVNNTDYLRVGDYYLRTGDYGDDYYSKYAAAVGFDYGQIPPRKKIIGASVYLYPKTSVSLDKPFRYWHKRNTWTEGDISYDNFIFTTYGFEIGPYNTQYSGYSSGVAYEFNVEVSFATSNNSFLLINRGSNTVTCDFYSTRASSELRPYLKITYEDVPPDKPTLLEPIGVYRDSASVIRFEWQYNSSVGGEQKKFDLQWSTNQSSWTTISETTENTYLDIPEDTFPVGNIYWRVRTYNEYDESSGYSDAAVFYSIGAPTTPLIQSVSDECRPLVEWISFDQQIYQLQILQGETVLYDTGDMPGISTRQYRIAGFLDDGEYSAKVRIKNEYDLWSEWGTYDFTISTTKPSKPTLSIQRTRYGQELMIAGTYDEVYIYRDGVCIGKDITHDNTPINGKEYEYFARAVVGDAFADSKTVLATASFRYGLLSDSEDIIELQHNISTVPGKNTINNQVGTANYYDGRKYPVYEHTEHTDKSLMLTYFLKNYADIERLEAMADRKNIVLYRDKRGRKLYGTMTGLTVQDIKQGFTVMFTIIATDYSEAIL